MLSDAKARALREGVLIPAHPLALTLDRTVDERRQRALSRYYLDAGAGGLAVGVHTTQFGIRKEGLLEPVLRLAAETVREEPRDRPIVMVAGVAGPVEQAVAEAELAAELGYDLAMVILRDLPYSTEDELIEHIAAVGEVLPVFGFYLQAAVGGPPLGFGFWARLAELPCLAAIKIAPFDRYRTIDVVRAVCESSRVDDIALYTGNDDNILVDLATTYRFMVDGTEVSKRVVGGLLGQNAVWTRAAVDLFEWARREPAPDELLTRAAQLTDANSAVFDVAGGFAGCVAGIHEVLRPRRVVHPGLGALHRAHHVCSPSRAAVLGNRGVSPAAPSSWRRASTLRKRATPRTATRPAVASSEVARCGAVKPADRPSARFFDRLSRCPAAGRPNSSVRRKASTRAFMAMIRRC